MSEYGDDEVSVSVSFTCEKCEYENEDSEQTVSRGDGEKIVICDECDAENTITFEPPEPDYDDHE
jgi:peptide subunit release factor 1 (eRF1)